MIELGRWLVLCAVRSATVFVINKLISATLNHEATFTISKSQAMGNFGWIFFAHFLWLQTIIILRLQYFEIYFLYGFLQTHYLILIKRNHHIWWRFLIIFQTSLFIYVISWVHLLKLILLNRTQFILVVWDETTFVVREAWHMWIILNVLWHWVHVHIILTFIIIWLLVCMHRRIIRIWCNSIGIVFLLSRGLRVLVLIQHRLRISFSIVSLLSFSLSLRIATIQVFESPGFFHFNIRMLIIVSDLLFLPAIVLFRPFAIFIFIIKTIIIINCVQLQVLIAASVAVIGVHDLKISSLWWVHFIYLKFKCKILDNLNNN